jgi:hypothetical protein
MNSRTFLGKTLTSLLSVTILVTYSMVAFAAPAKSVGELTVAGKDVRVNGETAQSGRTIFSATTIATSDVSGATLNLNGGGKIEIAPSSVVSVNSSDSFSVSEGSLTSYANTSLDVTVNGESSKISKGESATSKSARQTKGAGTWWIWTLVFGGAAAGIIIAALSDNNRVALGGGTTVVSPTR